MGDAGIGGLIYLGYPSGSSSFIAQGEVELTHTGLRLGRALFINMITDRHYRMDKSPPRHLVCCEIDGKPYRGTYWVAGKILTVSTGMGGTSTQVGGMPIEALAKHLLQKLAKEGKA